jgi:superfamily I DNA/RNA helicase
MPIDLRGLNPPQRDAVLHGDGPLLIVAGAGTGKTRTLAHRVAHLVERGVPAGEIVALAFTNKAADELGERVRSILGKRARPPRVSTFHAYCLRVLRREIGVLGYKANFTVYDSSDQLSALREVMREGTGAGRDLDVKRLQAIISRIKNDGGEPDDGDGADEYLRTAASLYPRYQQALKAYNALDFDDLLLLALRVFRGHPEVLERCRGGCRHLLVDEFQDTNAVQFDLVRALGGDEGRVTAVGDDDQSIYGWRGAAPGNMREFTRLWPKARVVVLEQNYRSSGRILAAANAVISRSPGRRPKKLWSALGDGVPLTILSCTDQEDEAAAAVEHIGRLVAEEGARPGDVAVLYRTNVQSRPLEDALRRARLPYVVVGGMRFYDRKEVKDLLAYLAVIHNPRDEIALLRIINYPHRGIGRETVLALQERSLREGRPVADLLSDRQALAALGERQARSVESFTLLLERVRPWFAPGRLDEAALALIKEASLDEAALSSSRDQEVARRRLENLREVAAGMKAFVTAEPKGSLGEYLAGVSLAGRDEEGDRDLSDRAVVLMTIHSAKGLEFPHVFFAGLEEGLLPHGKSEDVRGGMEEERRLAYVGLTRAKKSLVLSHAWTRLKRDRPVPASPSRFLEEIPDSLVRRVDRTSRGAAEDPGERNQAAESFFRFIKGL